MAKILIVEDDPIIQNMYQTQLQNHGFDVDTAVDGEEGLAKAFSKHPDLILLDIAMRKMDGITMLKRLREDPWGTKVIVFMLTNSDESKNMSLSINNKASKYFIKSNTDPKNLVAEIKLFIDNRS